MQLSALVVCVGSLWLAGCDSDAVGPNHVVGTYQFQGYSIDSLDLHPPPPAPYPFAFGGVVDSVHDVIILRTDRTYVENGHVWTHNSIDTYGTTAIDVHGTYTVSDTGATTIVLTPEASSGMTVGTGAIVGDTLKFSRYPGLWTFTMTH